MGTLGLEAVGVSGVGHAVELAIISGVGVAASCLDAVRFGSRNPPRRAVVVDAWKEGKGRLVFCANMFVLNHDYIGNNIKIGDTSDGRIVVTKFVLFVCRK